MEQDLSRPWVLDFDNDGDDGVKKPINAELQRFLAFAQQHEAELYQLREEIVDDKVTQSAEERRACVVRLDTRPPERAPAIELAQTGERSLRKVRGARSTSSRVPAGHRCLCFRC